MKPSQAHLDTAQRIYDRLGRGSVADIDAIAAALVAAHQDGIREGKRQAAEIATREGIRRGNQKADDAYSKFVRRDFESMSIACHQCAAAILSTITDEAE